MADSPFAQIDPAELRVPPEALSKFLEKLAGESRLPSRDRRQAPRYGTMKAVTVQAMDDGLRLRGQPHQAVIRDISTHGIGLLGTRKVRTPYLVVELAAGTSEPIYAMVEVVRCRRLDGIYEIGGRFVTRDEPRV